MVVNGGVTVPISGGVVVPMGPDKSTHESDIPVISWGTLDMVPIACDRGIMLFYYAINIINYVK